MFQIQNSITQIEIQGINMLGTFGEMFRALIHRIFLIYSFFKLECLKLI